MYQITRRLLLVSVLSLASSEIHFEPPKVSAVFQPDKAWSEDGQLLLELAVVKPPVTTFDTSVLKLTATNAGAETMFLDRELSIGVRIDLETDLEPKNGVRFRPDPRSVNYIKERTVDKPTAEQARNRIARLLPGESLTRTIAFRDPIRSGGMGRGYVTDGADGFSDYETFSEGSAVLEFPDNAKEITVCVYYERGFSSTPTSVLEEWFGIPVKDLGEPWPGRAISAPVKLSLSSNPITDP